MCKLWIRSQFDSSIIIQDEKYKHLFYLCYNKSYLRVLKLSKITGQPVNKKDFKGGVKLIGFDSETKTFWYYSKIMRYLCEHYSYKYAEHKKLLEEVLNEYSEYKDYNHH